MPANTSPIFTLTPQVNWGSADGDGGTAGPLKTANTAKDGTGTVLTVFTAGAQGGFVKEVRVRPVGTNVATVLRLFINNGSAHTTAANNALVDEVSIPAATISETSAQAITIIPCNFALPASYTLIVTIGTTVAAGVFVSAFGGAY